MFSQLASKFKGKSMSPVFRTHVKKRSCELGRCLTSVEKGREGLLEFCSIKSSEEEDDGMGTLGFSHGCFDSNVSLEPGIKRGEGSDAPVGFDQ